MNDATLDERLREGIVEMLELDDSAGDWDAIVRAAAREPRVSRPAVAARLDRRAPRVGRAILIAMALVLLGGSLAFALGDQLVQELAGGPPPRNPRSVQQQIADFSRFTAQPVAGASPGFRATQAGALVPHTTKLVIDLRTPHFGRVKLFTSRTTRGYCELIVRGGRGSGQCRADRVASRSPVVFGFDSTPGRPGSDLVDGRAVSSDARSLRIRFERGRTRTVVLSHRFFLFELGPDHSQHSTDPPVAFDVLDASGRTLGTRLDPLRVHTPPIRDPTPVAGSVRRLALVNLSGEQGTASIWIGHDARGERCFRQLHDGAQNMSVAWQCGAAVGRFGRVPDSANPAVSHQVPVAWMLGRSTNAVFSSHTYGYGWAAPTITRLRVAFQDGEAADVPLHSGYFVYPIPSAHWRAGHRPRELTAYRSDGTRAYRESLYPAQHCVYPGADRACGSESSGIGGVSSGTVVLEP